MQPSPVKGLHRNCGSVSATPHFGASSQLWQYIYLVSTTIPLTSSRVWMRTLGETAGGVQTSRQPANTKLYATEAELSSSVMYTISTFLPMCRSVASSGSLLRGSVKCRRRSTDSRPDTRIDDCYTYTALAAGPPDVSTLAHALCLLLRREVCAASTWKTPTITPSRSTAPTLTSSTGLRSRCWRSTSTTRSTSTPSFRCGPTCR
ncbi:unnamed protein product [Amoebophrya sp. A120]|nr:unnamed protein product [Amoebophrya sp. A120]|eukprot:GSA120T00002082001.1